METSRRDRIRRRKNKEKKITYKMQANFLLAFGVVVVAFILLIIFIIKINIKDGDKYAKRVLSQQSYTSAEIPFRRGDILDRNNVIMAASIKKYDLAIDVKFALSESDKKYLYKDDIKKVLTDYFEIPDKEVDEMFNTKADTRYYIIKRDLSSKVVDKYDDYINKNFKDVNAIKKGLWFEEKYERKYPLNTVASSVIGFTYDTNKGNWGIEEKYNSELNGSTGRIYGYYDSNLQLEQTVKNAEDGNSIVSTIDSNIQGIVEKYISKFQEDVGAENTAVLIGDPNNGEIIAMASSNGIYDLNNPRKLDKYYSKDEIKKMSDEDRLEALNKIWRNFCISDTYEPGSTFKPFVVAAALEEDLVKKTDTFYCDGKEVVSSGISPIRCAKRNGHGLLDLQGVLMFSCNDGMMKIGKSMGRKLFDKYQKHFNFSQKTGIDLNGESSGITYSEEQLNPVELATSSFGQGLNVTMVQMFAGISALINGGNYYEPHVVSKIINAQGATVKRIEPVLKNKVVSKETSRFILKAMKETVENGTAKYAKLPGYSIGGKTGTAQKLPRSEGNYLVSFIGCTPCDEPQLVIYTIVDQPHVKDQAQSKYAQELAGNILKEVMPFMNIYSENDNKNSNNASDTKRDNEEENNKKEEPEEVINDKSNANEEGNEYNAISSDVQNQVPSLKKNEE